MPAYRDRRKFQRLALNIIVTYKRYRDYERHVYLDNVEIEASAVDISAGGIGLHTTHLIPENSILDITLMLTSFDAAGTVLQLGPILAVGRVCSVVTWERKSYRIGISFVKIDKEHRVAISDFVNKCVHVREKKIIDRNSSSGKRYT